MGFLRKYALSEGTNPIAQALVDYGAASAIGAAGQQAANWATQGEDPNPLMSGAVFSPLGALALRSTRNKYLVPHMPISQAIGAALDETLLARREQGMSPIAAAALMGSTASGVASGVTNVYNLVTGQNNEPSAALQALSTAAPITYFLLGQRNKNLGAPDFFSVKGLPEPKIF